MKKLSQILESIQDDYKKWEALILKGIEFLKKRDEAKYLDFFKKAEELAKKYNYKDIKYPKRFISLNDPNMKYQTNKIRSASKTIPSRTFNNIYHKLK